MTLRLSDLIALNKLCNGPKQENCEIKKELETNTFGKDLNIYK